MNIQLAENLRAGRARLQLTQEQAAQKIGINYQTLADYEKGVSTPNVITAWKLADLYGVTLDELGGRNYEP